MSNFPRKLQQVFGGSLSAPSNIAKFASLAAGSPDYSLDLDAIQTARWLQAWNQALINVPNGNASPALQDMNALFYVLTTQLAYLLQKGMPDWLSTETYYTDDFVKVGGVVFISKTDNNLNNDPLVDTNSWKTLASTLNNSDAICKAWVCFNGVDGSIYSGYNVTSITKSAVGAYILNFGTAMPNALYAFVGSCGTPAGGSLGAGDDNIITGGFSGRVSTKSVNQLSVFCSDPANRNLQDSQAISIQIFGTTP